ncbi:hypothetical protein [Legionella saoudiensis]|uniref:hypothetical protein n=1 Tax=Legionella saoudiensis TaxID=1750561 RepID=UPI000730873C|nr:hypothetical protein [Legionella saoudiensis]
MLSLFCKAATNTGVVIASTTIAHVTYSISQDIHNRYLLWQRASPKPTDANLSKKEALDVNLLTHN